jgi:hypothetical protein
MKGLKILFGTMLVTAIASAFTLKKMAESAPSDKGFAVVELFTSEGCSSCPPADALIAKVQKESTGKPIYILAFHVDYWNRLGWKDAFSDAAYSQRQKNYSHWLKSEIYTPQAIVNGRTEFVGSEESNLRNAIKTGLQKDAKTMLSLNNVKLIHDKAALQYRADGETNNTSLLVALIEKNATSKVERGENAGRTLAHVQIVRKIQSINLQGHPSGSVNITLPAGFNAEGWEVIAFAQNNANGEITGATRAEFPGTMSASTK